MLNKALVFVILFIIVFELAMLIARINFALENKQGQCIIAKDTVMCVEMLKRLKNEHKREVHVCRTEM